MRKSSFRNICSLVLVLVPSLVSAFPDEEKAALAILSSQAARFALDGDRFLYAASGNAVFRIDLETFASAADQIPSLSESGDEGEADLAGDVTGLAIRGSTLFATQSDGDLLTIDLDSVTSEPAALRVADGELGDLVADPDDGDDQLYILDAAHNAVVIFDLSTETSTSIALVDGLGAPVTPSAVAFSAVDGSGDKVFITSDRGLIFVLPEGGSSVSQIAVSDSNKDLNAAAATPDGNFVLVTDATDNVVHVIDAAANAEVDTDPVQGGVNPIALTQNSGLRGVVVPEVTNPDDVFAYVSGSSGVSVIDLNLAGTTFGEPAVVDFNDEGTGDDEDDPMPASSSPGLLVASGDGYVYAAASNASILVVTENPFVTVSGTSLGDSALTSGATFNVVFRSDETGTYRVLVGGDSSANGTEAASGTVDAADADVTTAEIAFDASLFQEGANRVFVFVTDADGFTGRDAVDITVDTPPTSVEIVETGFGDEKVFVTFTRLTAADIDHYNVFVDTDAANISNPALEPVGTVTQTSSGDTLEAKVVGLVNGVTYFIGVEGVDAAGNVGPRTTAFSDGTAASATPEETVGLAGVTGEGGCALVRR